MFTKAKWIYMEKENKDQSVYFRKQFSVAEKVKKVLRDNNGVFTDEKRQEIAKELGDCLWYVSVMASDIGYSLEDIGKMNIDKLRSRQQRNMIHGNGDNR